MNKTNSLMDFQWLKSYLVLMNSTTQLSLIIGLLAAIAISIFVIAYLALFRKKGFPVVVLYGPSFGGKTTLFYLLAHNSLCETQTSMKENEASMTLSGLSSKNYPTDVNIQLIDFPGSERLSGRFLGHEQFRNYSLIVFLIDVSTLKAKLHDVAQSLYRLLINPSIYKRKTPFLVVFNKKDLSSYPIKVHIDLLKKEINDIRNFTTTSSQISNKYSIPKGKTSFFSFLSAIPSLKKLLPSFSESLPSSIEEEDDTNDYGILKSKETFDFGKLENISISFVESSLVGNGGDCETLSNKIIELLGK